MNSKQCDGRPALFENDVVAGIDCGDGTTRGVALFVFLKIIRHGPPTPDVIPVETGLHHKNAVSFFHDRVVEGDPRQFAEAFT